MTGDFTAGITDDITGLEDHDYIGLRDWVDFYEKTYTLLGMGIVLDNILKKYLI